MIGDAVPAQIGMAFFRRTNNMQDFMKKVGKLVKGLGRPNPRRSGIV